ncbi:nucleoside deaminase [Candidatus Terasakiella magnetica]|nr:nucleoside deaminase [Candidatus Terasakiella magnetica]
MDIALKEAEKAAARGEVPIGAVIVDSTTGEIIARAGNQSEADHDPSAHAEVVAIRNACQKLSSTRLPQCDLYVTLEPCTMCATAISFARIRRLYFGAYDPKGGGVDHGARFYEQATCHHKPDVYGGILESACSEILRRFFQEKR